MEGILASSLMAKVTSVATLAKAGGAASGSVLAGLSSMGVTLTSNAALGSAAAAASTAASTVGSLLGTLNVPCMLGSPAATLTALPFGAKAATAVIAGAVTVGAVPVVLGAVGFTGAGITASSLAAKMMSVSAIANGGGVASGGLVATLQSIGAAGLSLPSKVLVGSAGSALVSLVL